MVELGVFEPNCEMIGKTIHCSIETDVENPEFAFYVNLNGERKATFWYTNIPFIEYDCGEEIIHEFEITFFIRIDGEKIFSKSIKKQTSWSVGAGILEAVRNLVTKDAVILEFGSGIGSKSLAEICNVFSVEHDENFLNLYDTVNYIYSPLVEMESSPEFMETKSYDFDIIRQKIPSSIDMVIVDGPPEYAGRSGLLSNLSLFNDECIWIVDDVLRPKDQKLANYIALRFGLIQYRFWNFAILSKIPINNDALARIHSTSQQEYEDESPTYLKNYYPTSIKHSP